jgi:hypothetical protein
METRDEQAVIRAARNNADWCDVVARAHGAAGRFLDELWSCDQRLPMFYPNLVTLTAHGEAPQREGVAALLERGPPLPWAVKDSFARLDLTAMGFDCLFEARWISHPPGEPRADPVDSSMNWRRIETTAGLEAWEQAWRRDLSAGSAPIFPPALLRNPSLAFLAGTRGDAIVAGCVLNLSAGAIGLSNLFGADDRRAMVWSACRNQALSLAPGLPIVGYERGEDLALARAAGFRELGPLRVWLWTGGAS